MNLRRLMCLLLLTFMASAPGSASSKGPAEFFKKIDRQLCANFKSLKCHRKTHKQGLKKPKAPLKKLATEPSPAPAPVPKKEPDLIPPEPILDEPIIDEPVLPPEPLPDSPPVVKPPSIPDAKLQLKNQNDQSCGNALRLKGVTFESVAQPASSSACAVDQPVQLSSVQTNSTIMQFPDHPILNCAFALHFVTWLQELGAPEAKTKQGSVLSKFYTGPGFVCRGRNGDITSKISEHGFGNAVDVERLSFADGETLMVRDAQDPSSKAYETLRAMRASACTRFTTVLGPGSNAAHREHFHLDLGKHGTSDTYRICE